MNCRLEAAANKLSEFEAEIWNWYFEVVNNFSLESGIVAGEFKAENLKGIKRRLVLSGLNIIHQTFQAVASERTDKLRREKANG